MQDKINGAAQKQDLRGSQPGHSTPEARRDLGREAAEQLRRYVESSERFQRRVYGEEKITGR